MPKHELAQGASDADLHDSIEDTIPESEKVSEARQSMIAAIAKGVDPVVAARLYLPDPAILDR